MGASDLWAAAEWAAAPGGLIARFRTVEGEARLAMAAVCPSTGIPAVDQAAYEYGYYAGVADLAAVVCGKVKK